MKRKLLSILLSTAMIATILVGCGSGSTDDAASGDDAVVEDTTDDDAAVEDTTTDDAATEEDTTTDDAAAEEDATPENTITGDASAEDAFVIWAWNEDYVPILTALKEDHPEIADRLVFVNCGGSDYYQGKIDPILEDPTNELYPDIMLLEVDYIKKYVDSGLLLSTETLGITADDMANMYQYNIDLCTSLDGEVNAFFWQATPGCWALRADLCEKYLGTTDPETLQNDYFSSWDKILTAAETISTASNGTCRILSGYDDTFRVFSNAREEGWYNDSDVITIDQQIYDYIDFAKKLYDGEYTWNTTQWGTDWYANMAGDGTESNAALAYTACPWFVYWCLGEAWQANTIIVAGPQQFYWGGSALAATADCSDVELASTIIKYTACEKDAMVKTVYSRSDFVNNKAALQQVVDAGDFSCSYLYPDAAQDFLGYFLPLADTIDASTVKGEDMAINSQLNTQLTSYLTGEKDLDTAIADFKASVHDSYSYLSVE